MQLFVTESCPQGSAAALDDRRLVKACLETAQVLSVVHGGPYRATHRRHPVTVWAGRSSPNVRWTEAHFLALCAEYSRRFNRIHACATALQGLVPPAPPAAAALAESDFLNLAANSKLGLDFRPLPTFSAYRAYLNARWAGGASPPKWTRSQPPAWAACAAHQP